MIGSLYAGHLTRVAEVSVLTRRGGQARALANEGLHISGKSELTARVLATADPGALPEADLVIVATKATQLEEAAAKLRGRFPEAVLTIQNGLGAEEIVRRHGPWRLVSAVTFMSGVRRSDTHIEYELDTASWLGPYAGTATPFETALEIRDLLVEAGLQAEAFRDLVPAQWSKLIFNATVNTVAALTELPHVALFAEESEPTDLGHLVHELMDEGARVAAAAGVSLYARQGFARCGRIRHHGRKPCCLQGLCERQASTMVADAPPSPEPVRCGNAAIALPIPKPGASVPKTLTGGR